MSVNQIDINAVNERINSPEAPPPWPEKPTDTAGSTPDVAEELTDKEIYLSKLIRGSLRWRMQFYLLRAIMVVESVVWTVMDIVRAYRTRVAARINDNYQVKK